MILEDLTCLIVVSYSENEKLLENNDWDKFRRFFITRSLTIAKASSVPFLNEYIQYINHLRISCISRGIMGCFGNKKNTEQQKVIGATVEHLTNIIKELRSSTLDTKESTKELQMKVEAIQAPYRPPWLDAGFSSLAYHHISLKGLPFLNATTNDDLCFKPDEYGSNKYIHIANKQMMGSFVTICATLKFLVHKSWVQEMLRKQSIAKKNLKLKLSRYCALVVGLYFFEFYIPLDKVFALSVVT
ncbi:hypothetical protein Prudu_005657 [Prunus dulcis]|uniref:Uncharacterized protein n=1 Tax=Prunus dulcis TaxID=3755 RepID=A0A4Y1QY96_PRUDU|nr:hypothetical protein Prudu_005657 [Prunus dulcis]